MSENVNTSLTAPSDYKKDSPNSLDMSATPLSGKDAENAYDELNDSTLLSKFKKVERAFVDPTIVGQTYSLFSFIPSSGATPDKDGIYGMIKSRGNYSTTAECNARARFLIENVDSYHKIYHCYTGRPFPATDTSKFSAETDEVELKKKTTKIISEDIKNQKMKEKREIEEIKERQEALMRDAEEEEDPSERYTVLRVKKAQLIWTYKKTIAKLDDMKKIILKTHAEIEEMDASNPDFMKTYMDKYMSARKKAGLPEDEDSFVKYMGEDIELDFLEK